MFCWCPPRLMVLWSMTGTTENVKQGSRKCLSLAAYKEGLASHAETCPHKPECKGKNDKMQQTWCRGQEVPVSWTFRLAVL